MKVLSCYVIKLRYDRLEIIYQCARGKIRIIHLQIIIESIVSIDKNVLTMLALGTVSVG